MKKNEKKFIANSELSALGAYTNRVYGIILFLIPLLCLCTSTTIVTLYYIGWYPGVNKLAMWLFVLSDFIYLLIGLYFIRTGFDEQGRVKPKKLKTAKYVIIAIIIIQWNGISYIWPFTDFWAYAILFVIVTCFFFDPPLVTIATVSVIISLAISWVINGDKLLPYRDEYFLANMTLRFIGLFLMLLCINLISYFGGKFFVEELEKYVNYDPLTHLLNRRSINHYLKHLRKHVKSEKGTFCILLMDIDKFKSINDTYGHDCGDEVLKNVAQTIVHGVKTNDNVFRWGGEEILVLLKTDEKHAIETAERIRKNIENSPVNYRDEMSIPFTATIGVTKYTKGITFQEMMDDVDSKLYYGKRNGRNQVVSVLPDDYRPMTKLK